MLIVADGDVLAPPARLREAVALVAVGAAPWAIPYSQVHRLLRRSSEAFMREGRSAPEHGPFERPPYTGTEGGGIVVLPTATWDDVGGVDPRFTGWGGEDLAFGWTLRTLHGTPTRTAGALLHLWHPHAAGGPRNRPPDRGSAALLERYRRARDDPAAMRALIAERG